ncbi:ABC transporter substrate-binding protein [Piscinibacter sp. XHJ-5]|uniref:ABC transporter substrate-binding protein n=1 Tax=Piscinibacter sp. XHJ-5 TaxID=3037797 RepID=UPI002452CA86|nr:ABC transporter substrate-binding protein [Piscinibacter sp. XHJ-5]
MKQARLLLAAAALTLAFAAPAQTRPAPKVLRYAFEVAETSFDPAKINDLYSRTLTPHIFEAPYKYDHLARPVKIKPLTADGMPQHSADFRTWTVKIQPGIYFADDPAFKGQRRELVAQDYVYAIKRFADPANKSPVWTGVNEERFVGLAELRQQALDQKKPFDYDREIDGLRALDRYTVQFKVEEPRPRFIETLAASDLLGAVAREVVEFYGDQIDGHPVGTGPFKLVQWRRSSFIALERNPGYRELLYDAEPAADDAEGQALLARFKGRRLPLIDRVEISIIEEEQPRWLSFVNGESDFAYRVGYQFVSTAMPNGKVAPNLAKKGVRGYRVIEPASNSMFFNMEDATVGGYTPERIALRRAIALGMDAVTEINHAYSGQGVVANSPLLPFTTGYDPQYKSEFSEYNPPRAKALLDMYGYVDRDGDGWRDMPDGSPLVLRLATQSNARDRKISEVMKKNMDALGIRVSFNIAQWPENLKAARAGKLPMWSVGGYAAAPDGQGSLARYHSKQIGGQNMARFKLPAFDAVYERIQVLPDGPERLALFDQAKKLAVAYMPYKFKLNRLSVDMAQGWVVGYRRPVFWQEWWHYVDIDDSKRAAANPG